LPQPVRRFRHVLTLAAVVFLAVAAYIVVRDLIRGYWTTRGARVEHYTLHRLFDALHDLGYWHSHMRQYLAFYARHCA
jgi:hypothetical protein